MLTLLDDVSLAVPAEVVFDVALIVGLIEDISDRTRVPPAAAFRGDTFREVHKAIPLVGS